MRRGGRRTICAHGLAGGESLLQAASGYSNALRRVAQVVERGRHSCRGRKRFAGEIHETGRDAKILVWKRLQILLLQNRNEQWQIDVQPNESQGAHMSNSNMSVQPYLFFNGRCEEALEFYRSAVGAEVEMLSR